MVAGAGSQAAAATATPIQHLVVIFGENISFDHYFGTYPNASNVPGEPSFTPLSGTPTSNNYVSNPSLLSSNPNLAAGNNPNASNPFRLDRTQAVSGDQGHSYTPQQQAADNGMMDLFPLFVGNGTAGGAGAFGTKALTMGYFDGNTVTAFWNYAQGFAMSDNSFGDQYGPSTPGAINVISGQTNGMTITNGTSTTYWVNDTHGGKTMINDVDPSFDTCSVIANGQEAFMTGKHVGDLLTAANVTWGGFMGGFNLSLVNPNGTTGCARSSANVAGASTADYIQHHNWFMYYNSALNAAHTRPTSTATIGANGDAGNHEYDLQDFYTAVSAGNFPAVSFIKMPAYQDAHAGYSDPLDEQQGVVALINFLQQQPGWSSTAVIIAYDDSDGWYDHVYVAPTSSSFDATADKLNGNGICGTGTQQNGIGGLPVNGRCGPGPRLPMMVISPWAKPNYISHVQSSQVSVTKFIEDNWLSGQRLGQGSFDANSGSLMDMFNFSGSGNAPRRFLNPIMGYPSRALTHDFANNGFSSVAFRDTSGNVGIWLMNGTKISSSSVLGIVDPRWSMIGQTVLNNNGAADIIWRDNTTGNVGVWLMNGSTVTSSSIIGNAPATWSLAATGRFNGGNGAEMFWRDTSGNITLWQFNGTAVTSTTIGNVPTNWAVVGTGDFDKDGNTDILWRDTSGNLAIWFLNGNGTKINSAPVLGNVPTTWSVAGTGDFNGDGSTDIVWRDTSGNVAIWLMNGAQIMQSTSIGNVPLNWTLSQTGDYNGDGSSDILWVDSSANVAAWYMNGTKISSATTLGNMGANWSVQSQNTE